MITWQTITAICDELVRLKADAVAAVAEAKRVRRGDRDISFEEDAELSRVAYRRTDVLLKHLLVGHDGQPCPAGDRPIVSREDEMNRAVGARNAELRDREKRGGPFPETTPAHYQSLPSNSMQSTD
jgi:hypothetical protein